MVIPAEDAEQRRIIERAIEHVFAALGKIEDDVAMLQTLPVANVFGAPLNSMSSEA